MRESRWTFVSAAFILPLPFIVLAFLLSGNDYLSVACIILGLSVGSFYMWRCSYKLWVRMITVLVYLPVMGAILALPHYGYLVNPSL
jgi:hypothetical protein